MRQHWSENKVGVSVNWSRVMAREARRFVLWLPVCLGLGVWLYFVPANEPSVLWGVLGLAPAGVLLVHFLFRRLGIWAVFAAWCALMGVAGFSLAQASAWAIAAPVVHFPVSLTLDGRVIEISRGQSGAPRLLLDRLTVYGLDPGETPARLRLTLPKTTLDALPVPGHWIRTHATLLPIGEPVEPGAFDFRRRAFFDRLGGLGVVRGAVLNLPDVSAQNPLDRLGIWLAEVRANIANGLRRALPGRAGAFAAAIIVGERAGIDPADAEALRASNLAHLLAISGLHMGLLTGLVFTLGRVVLALVPGLALRVPTKKIAAILAVMAGASYLGLSGATVATQRAFVMVSVAFLAILVDRPALSLRALALAAAIVLIIRPVSLLDVGFQMSFAAALALVSGFETLRHWHRERQFKKARAGQYKALRALALYAGGLLTSSLLAGLATAPFAAFHFNRTAPLGLFANLAAVPIMGFWIAPLACLAAVLAPLGLAGPALKLMGMGIEAVMQIAHGVAAFPHAVQPVWAGPPIVLGLIVAGGLWLFLWRGGWRWGGLVTILAGVAIWMHPPPRPDVLIAPDLRLAGVMGPQGRALDRARGQGFAADIWLRRDGDLGDQAAAAVRPGFRHEDGVTLASLPNDWQIVLLGRRGRDPVQAAEFCRPRVLLISPTLDDVAGPCRFWGRKALLRSGALAIWADGPALRIVTGRDPHNRRLWTR